MTTDAVGGVWTYTLELVRSLYPFGIRFHLAVMGTPPTAEQESQAVAAGAVVHVLPYKLEWMDNPWEEVDVASRRLLELEKRIRPHLIHLNGYVHAALPWEAPTLVVAHSCVTSWYESVRGMVPPKSFNTYHRRVRLGLQAAGGVTAPTRAMLKALRRHHGAFRELPVVYNARRPDYVRPGCKQPFILSAGRIWDEAKNIGILARVARELSWPVKVAGETHHPSGSDAHMGENVRLLGRLQSRTLSEQLSEASIYALPARYEPFGLSALEAGLAGCALVLGNISSLREVWGDAALFVDPDDERGLTEAIQSLIEDRTFRRHMAEKALERALLYTPERMAIGYLGCYETLLREHADLRRSGRAAAGVSLANYSAGV